MSSLPITNEELLLEVVAVLRDAYLKDAKELDAEARTDFSEANYPKFMAAAAEQAAELKDVPGYRRLALCAVPSFALGLVMASRVWRHYTHAPWFTLTGLGTILQSHGAVRDEINRDKCLTGSPRL